MKKILSVLLALAALLALATSAALAAEIALVTDVGTIDDESFNQACWEGVKAYAEANGKTYQYYQPGADSTDERLNSIDQAVSEGAKVIVCPGYLFGETVATAQELYPDVDLSLIHISLHPETGWETETGSAWSRSVPPSDWASGSAKGREKA